MWFVGENINYYWDKILCSSLEEDLCTTCSVQWLRIAMGDKLIKKQIKGYACDKITLSLRFLYLLLANDRCGTLAIHSRIAFSCLSTVRTLWFPFTVLTVEPQRTLISLYTIPGRTKDDLHAALRVLTKRYSTNTCTHPHLSWHKNNWINLNYYTVLRYLVTALQVFKRKFSPNKQTLYYLQRFLSSSIWTFSLLTFPPAFFFRELFFCVCISQFLSSHHLPPAQENVS